MKRDRILAWALSAALALSLVTVPASAAYSDVTEAWSWASGAIEDMTERGMFMGFEDGTFRPAEKLTTVQALILAGRICAPLELRQQIGLDRRSQITGLFGGEYRYFWDEAATCLEAGVLSYDELRSLCQTKALDRPITMEDFSVYMVRAMQLEPMARRLTSYSLGYFSDAAEISTQCRPYVFVLYTYGLVHGDENKKFGPKEDVDRARSATLISRALAFMEERGTSVELEEYTDCAWTAGTISGVTAGDNGDLILSLENDGAETRTVTCGADIRIYQDNMLAETGSLKAGVYARVCYDGQGRAESVRLSGSLETFTGGIAGLSGTGVSVVTAGETRALDIGRFTQVRVGQSLGERSLIELEAGYTTAVCKVDDMGRLVYLELQGGTRQESGLIAGVESLPGGGWTMTVRSFNGMARQYEVPVTAAITANGVTTASINGTYTGKYVTLRVSNETDQAVQAEIDTLTRYVQGAIRERVKEGGVHSVTLVDPETNRTGSYQFADTVPVTYEGEKVALDEVRSGWYVTARISGGAVVEMECYSGSSVTVGTISAPLEFSGKSVTMTVLRENGESVSFVMSLSGLPTIKRGGSNATVDKLRRGDSVTVTVRYHKVTEIAAVPQSANVTGTIQRKVEEISGTTLDLLLSDGSQASYRVNNSVSVTQNGKAVALNSLKVGYKVALVVSGDEVYSIEVEGAYTTSTELRGSVLYVNASERTILFRPQDGEAPITVSVPGGTVILETATGRTLTLSALAEGDVLEITGSYDGLSFRAVTILKK